MNRSIIDLIMNGLDYDSIAERTGVCSRHVSNMASELRRSGILVPYRRVPSGQTAKAVELARQGLSRDEIAQRIGSPNRQTVRVLLSKARRAGQLVPKMTAMQARHRNGTVIRDSKRVGLE